MTLQFTVIGQAMPQGSKSARVVGKGPSARAVMTEGFGDGPRKRRAWRDAVSDEARKIAVEAHCGLLDGPLRLDVCFYLVRPKTLPKRILRPIAKPDVGKLARAVEDSLTHILIADDARIVDLRASKYFAEPGQAPHCRILLSDALLLPLPRYAVLALEPLATMDLECE